ELRVKTIQEGFLYAAVANVDGSLQGLYVTKDFGQNWTKIALPVYKPPQLPGFAFPSNDNLAPSYDVLKTGQGGEGGQGNYDISLTVDPTNPNVIYLGGTLDGQPIPVGGLLRIDTTLVRDAHNLTAFDSHRNDGGLLLPNTLGAINLKDTTKTWGLITDIQPFFNVIR